MGFADLIAGTDRATHDHLGSEAVTYTPDGGSPTTTTPSGEPLLGMFDKNFVLVDPARPGVESVHPVITLRLEDLPTDPEDDDPILGIDGTDYKVQERQKDGPIGGSIMLMLHKVSV